MLSIVFCFLILQSTLLTVYSQYNITFPFSSLLYNLSLPNPWCIRLLSLCFSIFVFVLDHGQTSILASGPPLYSKLWDFRLSPGRGSYCHSYAKRLTTCHEKIAECQGHKSQGSGKHVNHFVHSAFKALKTGLPRPLVHFRERVGLLAGPNYSEVRPEREQSLSRIQLGCSASRGWYQLVAST